MTGLRLGVLGLLSLFAGLPSSAAPQEIDTLSLSTWQIDSVPLMSAGAIPSDPLFQVRGVVITENRVIVGERSTGMVRFYTHDGRLAKTIGGLGDGPGEYRRLHWLRRFNDKLYVYDSRLSRLTSYTLDGLFLESLQVRPIAPFASVPVVGVFSDGSLLVEATLGPRRPQQKEVRRQPIALLLYNQSGTFVDSIGGLKGSEAHVEPRGRGGRLISPQVFGRQSAVVVEGSRFYVVENDSYDIQVFAQDGTPVDVVRPRVVPPPTPVRRRDIALMRQRFMETSNSGTSLLEEVFSNMDVPDHLPPYGWASWSSRPLLTAVGNSLWALRYGGLSSAGPEWFVYHAGIGHVGTVTAPDDVILFDVRDDLAAVVRLSQHDEEIVELRRVQRR